MVIVIRTVGNRSLYRSLYEDIDSETKHRTASGALRRLEKISRDSQTWFRSVGQWGHVEVDVDGSPLEDLDLGCLLDAVEEYLRYPDAPWPRSLAERLLAA